MPSITDGRFEMLGVATSIRARRAGRLAVLTVSLVASCVMFAATGMAASAAADGITAVSQSATQVNVTNGTATVTVTFAVTDAEATASVANTSAIADVAFASAPQALAPPANSVYTATSVALTSGTWASGRATETITLPAGAWGTYTLSDIEVIEQAPPQAQPTGTQTLSFSGSGVQPITAVVTAVPAKPTNVSFGLKLESEFGFLFYVDAPFTWTNPGPPPLSAVVDSYSGGGCGTNPFPTNDEISFDGYNFGLCTVKFHTFNGYGASPQVTVTALL
jgi:hypothetical protein